MSKEQINKEDDLTVSSKPSETKVEQDATFEWYSLRVISGKEQATKENILIEVEEAGIESEISEVFLPYEKVIEVRNNKKKIWLYSRVF